MFNLTGMVFYINVAACRADSRHAGENRVQVYLFLENCSDLRIVFSRAALLSNKCILKFRSGSWQGLRLWVCARSNSTGYRSSPKPTFDYDGLYGSKTGPWTTVVMS